MTETVEPTDISDDNVMCVVNQEQQEEIEISKSELGNITVKVEESDPVPISLHHDNVNIHGVNVTTSDNIITIPVCVGSLSPCLSYIGDSGDTVVAPISVSCITSADNINQTHTILTSTSSMLTWEEAVSAEILPIRCKDTNAELHKRKFGSGNKGKCIKVGNEWYSPTEFESICGRGNSKDWKRSIRFGGRTLQTLIDKKFLVPHASSCICANCVDDSTATGPIRPFTPYQRKRKNRNNDTPKATKLERLTSKDSTTDDSFADSSDVGTPLGLASSLNPLTQALIKINQSALPTCNSEAWKVMEDAVEKLVSASVLLKSHLQEMKERTNNELVSLRSQLDESNQNLQQALNQQQQQVQQSITLSARNLEPQILRIFDSNRLQAYSIEVLDPETFKQLQVQTATTNNTSKVSTQETSNVLPPISQLF